MRTVEGINITEPFGEFRPTRSLNSAGDFEGQLIKADFAFVDGHPARLREIVKAGVRGDDVESVVVNPNVADLLGHMPQGAVTADGQCRFVAGRAELQNRGTKLETLRPFRPAP